MKKLITLLAIAMVAGIASAAIWDDDFSSWVDGTDYLDPDNPAPMAAVRDDLWLIGNPDTAPNAAGELVLAPGGTGQTRGTAIGLSQATYGWVDGQEYTLSFDWGTIGGDGAMELDLYLGSRDLSGTVNTYNLDLLSATGVTLNHTFNGSGSLTNLSSTSYTSADSSTSESINFTYSGTTKDVTLVFAAKQATGRIDNIQIIPEPATIGLLGLAGGALIVLRRRTVK